MFAVVWVVTLVALLYAEENWRGAQACGINTGSNLKRAARNSTWPRSISKPVPDEQNFMPPHPVFVKSWFVEVDRTVFTNTTERFVKKWQDNYEQVFNHSDFIEARAHNRYLTDLVAWDRAFEKIRSGQTNLNEESESGEPSSAARGRSARRFGRIGNQRSGP